MKIHHNMAGKLCAYRNTVSSSLQQSQQALGSFFPPLQVISDALVFGSTSAISKSVCLAFVYKLYRVNHYTHTVVIRAPFTRTKVMLCCCSIGCEGRDDEDGYVEVGVGYGSDRRLWFFRDDVAQGCIGLVGEFLAKKLMYVLIVFTIITAKPTRVDSSSYNIGVVGVDVGAPNGSCPANLFETTSDGVLFILGGAYGGEVGAGNSNGESAILLSFEAGQQFHAASEMELGVQRCRVSWW